MKELKMNYLAVLVSVIWMFVLGFLWYGPLFGEPWMGMVGLDMSTIEANPPGASLWVSNVIGSALPIIMLAWLFTRMQVTSAITGMVLGALMGLIFFLSPTIVNGMFAQQPYELAWITGGFQTVGWAGSGMILGAWKKHKAAAGATV